jgi:hypothetical protein
MAWVVFNFHELNHLIYFIVLLVFIQVWRVELRNKTGSAGKYFDYIMVFEIILGISIVLLQYAR